MGMCPINRTYKIIPNNEAIDPFIKCKEQLIEILQKLHSLHMKYLQMIDDCIVKNDKVAALNLKSKQLKFKEFSVAVQFFVTKLDNEDLNIKGLALRKKYADEILGEVESLKAKILSTGPGTLNASTAADEEFDIFECELSNESKERQSFVHEELKSQENKLKRINKSSSLERRAYYRSVIN